MVHNQAHMDHIAEIKIKHKHAQEYQKILEVDKDYRDGTVTTYSAKNDTLIMNINCTNLVSLKKSIHDSMKKITLIEEVSELVDSEKK